MNRTSIIFAMIFLLTAMVRLNAASIWSRVAPDLPTENDSIAAIASFKTSQEIQFYNSAVSWSNDTVRVTLSYEKISSSLLHGTIVITDTVGIGRLAQEKYTLLFKMRIIQVVFCETVPCDPEAVDSLCDTVSFRVAPPSQQMPILSGFDLNLRPGMVSGTTIPPKIYRYTNGDTLSIGMIHRAGCCAHYTPYLAECGDTLVVAIRDISEPCECGSRMACATAMISNMTKTYRYARLTLFSGSTYSSGHSVNYNISLDTAAPSLCVNMMDTVNEGLRLYVDSSWFAYEIVAPLLGEATYLRLQPGGGSHVKSNYQYLYADSIFAADGLTEEFNDTDFSESNWTVVRLRNGVVIQPKTLASGNGRLLEICYADLNDEGNTSAMYRKRTAQEKFVYAVTPRRIFLKASCRNPNATTILARPEGHARPLTKNYLEYTMIVDTRGRVVFRGNVSRLVKASLPANGVYFIIRQGRALPFLSIPMQ